MQGGSGHNKLSMSGTFKITKRESMAIGESSHLVKSEQKNRNKLSRAIGGANKSTRSINFNQTAAVGMNPMTSFIPRDEALRVIDTIREKNNREILQILAEEQANEAQREAKLREVKDENEKNRLEKIFGIERARASERIVGASDRHEAQLRDEMRRLGLM
jgi:hypothetical protein